MDNYLSVLEMRKPDKQQIWHETLESVKVSVSPAIFATWISQTHLSSLKKIDKSRYLAEVGCSSAFVKTTIERRYFGLIQDSLISSLGSPSDLTFVVKSDPANKIDEGGGPAPLFQDKNTEEELNKRLTEIGIRPGFTFHNFAVSPSNQMAWAAAEAVSREPGTAYNPLFLWGGVGVGKTHLMHAVGHTLLKLKLETKIAVCSGEEFTNDIVNAIRNKNTQSFRNKYRNVAALFIDDIQFIAGKDAVQDEFFHTFNAVTRSGGQIILTSDKPPTEIAKLEERLRSRFEAGLIVDIGPPDFELRCAIVQIKSQEKGLLIEEEKLVHLIAGNILGARQIEGFLTRLGSESKIKNLPITEDLITSTLGKGEHEIDRSKNTNPEIMIEAVCKHYSIGRRAILGKGRSKFIARSRQVLMYLIRTELNLSLEEVGRLVGGRDHSTVIHGVDKITKLASENVQIREDILRIKSVI
ncbi:MAG: Chromosomal replication initiator protein DnaA [Candidatus Woesebacteria bacterium GW2011_GWB1_43_14]|uniref:Chromosomal replication initiator protein DnaA n=1 Tax=Candidatus Woesebacteria bacterium GW2011_GWB1_43_14 TaxID=1618578 RepID=A0A0G1DN51_9BACT|nr:MAG: chromosomal replication initiator protein DnaA, chromosomal replication initiator protein [Candidatus Woesebacteria bacterium GW2011_GWC1_42_9]KKS98997.1 MAG: Chromosomal replication initiator protein DnaA [Candidatus Woesebacteria bacterium GW2011_GWB1_43_14]